MVFVALIAGEPKIWLRAGSEISAAAVGIPAQPTRRHRHDWTTNATQPDRLVSDLMVCMARGDVQQCPVQQLLRPIAQYQLREHEMQLVLQSQLPLTYVPPSIECQPYDYTVNGSRWQVKVAGYRAETDAFCASVQKKKGRRGSQQYATADFDWLLLQLAEHEVLQGVPPCVYLIPMHALEERGLVGRDPTGACVRLYPHRPARTGAAWAQAYAIDVSTPSLALMNYLALLVEMGQDTTLLQARF